jgi:hypothetical protein
MKRTSTLAVFGLLFAVAGCPPRENEYLPNTDIPEDKLVIIERSEQNVEEPDRMVIIERSGQRTDQPAPSASEARGPIDEPAVRTEGRPPISTVAPPDPSTPWPASAPGEQQNQQGTTGTPESDK